MKQIKHHSQLVNAIIASNLPISSTDKLVLSTLVTHLNLSKNEAFPSQARIASVCGLCRATVNRAIMKLSELGYISIKKIERINGIGLRNLYTLKSSLIKALSVVIPKLGTLASRVFKQAHSKPTSPNTGTNQTSSILDKANKDFEEHYTQISNTRRADLSVVQALKASLRCTSKGGL
ncbi:helix-turn-helix domain-containing protein [Vibrio casei]|uniref:helix-turn-helix domain-containing protein n=1 Tax=Vibrio casei TaxID=673372 RepID=UPI001868FCBA|nr:helix-turn-helix domain-containing protein [Vibrio casei]